MKSLILTKTPALLALVILLAALVQPVQAYTGIPTISIVNVVKDTSVTIQTFNFPPGEDFTVRMGNYGTLGIGGIVIETFHSGTGGSFQRTFTIPAALVGKDMIAIRMDSAHGYYSYNWFYNNDGNVPPSGSSPSGGGPSYTGIPTFSIVSVVTDTSVVVQTNNFPANVDFTVRMGAYGTYGVGGTVIETFNSGAGGSFQKTFTIPASLAGSARIAIRMDSSTGYYYAYNWFYNNTATTTTTTPAATGYTGIPTFSIVSVVKDTSVTIQTYNFPPNETFTCRMGAYGTYASGGTVCGDNPSGSGGSFTLTLNIPASMAGADRIAIRLDSSTGYYYAYNWFYNTTTY